MPHVVSATKSVGPALCTEAEVANAVGGEVSGARLLSSGPNTSSNSMLTALLFKLLLTAALLFALSVFGRAGVAAEVSRLGLGLRRHVSNLAIKCFL